MTHRADAGARRRHDRVVGAEDLDKSLDKRQCLLLVSGVDMHLATARLLGRKLNDLAEALQHPYRCLSYLREHGIGQAGDKQGDSHSSDLPGNASRESTGWSAGNLVKFNRLDRRELVADEAVRMGGQVVAVAP